MMTVSPSLDVDGSMLAVGDARERRQRLALAARAHDDYLVCGHALELVGVDEVVVGDVEVAQACEQYRCSGSSNGP